MQDIVTLLVGGTISHGMFSIVGQCAEETLRQISVDKAFLAWMRFITRRG